MSSNSTPPPLLTSSTPPVPPSAAMAIRSAHGSSGLKPIVLGICSMDVKARSKAMREILTRLKEMLGEAIEIKIFGDEVILKEDISRWPPSNVLISFFSTDFPLDKAIAYTQQTSLSPAPIVINDLPLQAVLWDRRLVLAILDAIGVPTPRRMEVTRDGGPAITELVQQKLDKLGIKLDDWEGERNEGNVRRGKDIQLSEDTDSIVINGHRMEKPFVEKPVSGEDHNVYIYYKGGGGRRLFRKVGNKSSEHDPDLVAPRTNGSYIYEEFINVENAEDIKIYTVGPTFFHAETRKSPVVDGLVRRNTDGKEIRFITQLSEDEKRYAKKICEVFGQMVCGFDLLRCEEGGDPKDGGRRSLIIDVNGWSFVKGNQAYYDKAAEILATVCERARVLRNESAPSLSLGPGPTNGQTDLPPVNTASSVLKASVTIFRHSDRTPKMKSKFSFSVSEPWSQPFVSLLRGHKEEIILRDPLLLDLILDAVRESLEIGCPAEIEEKLKTLQEVLGKKKDMPGTKAQLKPAFAKDKTAKKVKDESSSKDREDEGDETETDERIKEWIASGESKARENRGGPASSSGSMKDVHMSSSTSSSSSLNSSRPYNPYFPAPEGLEKVQLVVKWGGESTHAARYQSKDLGENMKKDFTVMNSSILKNVKIYTSSERRVINTADIFARALLDKESTATSSSAGNPKSIVPTPLVDHLIIRRDLLDDSNAAKELMDGVKKKLKILLRPGESERRPGLFWPLKKEPVEVVREVVHMMTDLRRVLEANYASNAFESIKVRWCSSGDNPFTFKERWEKLFDDWVGVKKEKFDPSRVSELYDSLKYDALHNRVFLFAIFDPQCGKDMNSNTGPKDRTLHELYARAKLLFDLVAPQEYGIEPEEKEQIGLLTSLPLLRKVIEDLNLAMNSDESHASFYFTKESHIYTFVNLVIASGLPTLENKKIPELDYASHITFELYERTFTEDQSKKEFSLRLSISEGAHSSNVLDSSVDARHSLNVQPRRKMTAHIPVDVAIEKLSKHFDKGHTFSTTPLEGDAIYYNRRVTNEAILPLSRREVPSSGASSVGDKEWTDSDIPDQKTPMQTPAIIPATSPQ